MLLNQIHQLQLAFASEQTRSSKRSLGQFLTNDVVAAFMCEHIDVSGMKHVRVLDAGAGAGILGVAAVLRCIEQGVESVELDVFEIDNNILDLLKQNLKLLEVECSKNCVSLNYRILHRDYILDEHHEKYDVCCINPPYFKCTVQSPYHKSTAHLFKGCPNIYASFVAKALSQLVDQGQLVFITPRSFTNGYYFKGFRQYMMDNASFELFHIFGSREALFKESNVLQENIIVKVVKSPVQKENVVISCSKNMLDLGSLKLAVYHQDFLIRKTGNLFIFLPENGEQAKNVSHIERWSESFTDNGYFISTGPIVSYRTSQVVRSPDPKFITLPLITSHYLKNMRVTAPNKNIQYFALKDDYSKWLIKNSLYVLIKRISSKDDKQRLIVAVSEPCDHDNVESIALENHVNYIGHLNRELGRDEAYGIAVYLQSEAFEQYYSCLSGNTQINATDIRSIPMPSISHLKALGAKHLKETERFMDCLETKQITESV